MVTVASLETAHSQTVARLCSAPVIRAIMSLMRMYSRTGGRSSRQAFVVPAERSCPGSRCTNYAAISRKKSRPDSSHEDRV